MADDDMSAVDNAAWQDADELERRHAPDAIEAGVDEIWMDIELDFKRELAALAREEDAADRGDDGSERAADEGRDEDEERRKRLAATLGAQGAPSGLEKADERGAKQADKHDDRPFPEDLARSYYFRADPAGDQHVYADSKGNREIFQASETRLRTKLNDPQCVKLMLDTAAHRGWSSVVVNGSKDFRREAWLEGQARGINVDGYKPNELDLQELKRREQAHLRNEIVPVLDQERPAPAEGERLARDPEPLADASERPSVDSATSSADTDQPGDVPAHSDLSRADRGSADYKDGIEGVLIEQGSRPYRDNPKADPSPYAVLQDARGRQHTAWGVAIPNALLRAGAQTGDEVRLRETGMERVMKSVIREVDGNPVRVEQPVNRRAWEAEVTRDRDEIERDHHEQVADKDAPAGSARQDRIKEAESNVTRMVDTRDRALHVGLGRDAALSDGIYANDARSKEYMATGRAAAARNPELVGAASIEAYVERKVRAKFGADPIAVERAMTVARDRIGQAIARGYDFPQPRVIETRERTSDDRQDRVGALDGRQRGEGQALQEPRREQERDMEREQLHQRDRKDERSR